MNKFLSLLVISIFIIQLTSSASFPNPPQFPSPNASADEWTLFWKLLHNYYAIIARPRFGKRSDFQSKHPLLLGIINPNPTSFGNDRDELFTYSQPDQRRR